jgi:hypothetical protein
MMSMNDAAVTGSMTLASPPANALPLPVVFLVELYELVAAAT